MTLLLKVTDLTVEYPTRFGTFQAVKNLDMRLEQGEIHGLVGESGAGKSTIGLRLQQSYGKVVVLENDIVHLKQVYNYFLTILKTIV